MTHLTLKPIPKLPPQTASLPVDERWPRLGLRWGVLAALMAGLMGVFLLSLALGSVSIPLDDIGRVLLGGEASREAWTNIILKFRLPKALTAMLAGAALGVGGLMMQTLFRNPLAEPYILGISAGASLGVALVVLSAGTVGTTLIAGIGLAGDIGITAAAMTGAGVVLLLVLLLARRVRSNMTLLIMGLMFGYMTSGLVSLLLYFNLPDRVQTFINWTFGSFGGVTWDQMRVLAPAVIAGLALALALSKALNALLLGENYARSMGLNVPLARVGIIGATAMLAGVVTAFCGPIGFIGIAAPHLCRSLLGTSDHRALIPATVLLGALVALLAALLAELPGSRVILPLNAVTALMGAPVVIWVILRQRNLRESFAS
jgi:iron complex transport system permease protein